MADGGIPNAATAAGLERNASSSVVVSAGGAVVVSGHTLVVLPGEAGGTKLRNGDAVGSVKIGAVWA